MRNNEEYVLQAQDGSHALVTSVHAPGNTADAKGSRSPGPCTQNRLLTQIDLHGRNGLSILCVREERTAKPLHFGAGPQKPFYVKPKSSMAAEQRNNTKPTERRQGFQQQYLRPSAHLFRSCEHVTVPPSSLLGQRFVR